MSKMVPLAHLRDFKLNYKKGEAENSASPFLHDLTELLYRR